jgi:hypothetical protein
VERFLVTSRVETYNGKFYERIIISFEVLRNRQTKG